MVAIAAGEETPVPEYERRGFRVGAGSGSVLEAKSTSAGAPWPPKPIRNPKCNRPALDSSMDGIDVWNCRTIGSPWGD